MDKHKKRSPHKEGQIQKSQLNYILNFFKSQLFFKIIAWTSPILMFGLVGGLDMALIDGVTGFTLCGIMVVIFGISIHKGGYTNGK